MDDFWVHMEEQKKRKRSYLGRIPSVDFWDEDILTRETLDKVSKALGFD